MAARWHAAASAWRPLAVMQMAQVAMRLRKAGFDRQRASDQRHGIGGLAPLRMRQAEQVPAARQIRRAFQRALIAPRRARQIAGAMVDQPRIEQLVGAGARIRVVVFRHGAPV